MQISAHSNSFIHTRFFHAWKLKHENMKFVEPWHEIIWSDVFWLWAHTKKCLKPTNHQSLDLFYSGK